MILNCQGYFVDVDDKTVEKYKTLKNLAQYGNKHEVPLPIMQAVVRVLSTDEVNLYTSFEREDVNAILLLGGTPQYDSEYTSIYLKEKQTEILIGYENCKRIHPLETFTYEENTPSIEFVQVEHTRIRNEKPKFLTMKKCFPSKLRKSIAISGNVITSGFLSLPIDQNFDIYIHSCSEDDANEIIKYFSDKIDEIYESFFEENKVPYSFGGSSSVSNFFSDINVQYKIFVEKFKDELEQIEQGHDFKSQFFDSFDKSGIKYDFNPAKIPSRLSRYNINRYSDEMIEYIVDSHIKNLELFKPLKIVRDDCIEFKISQQLFSGLKKIGFVNTKSIKFMKTLYRSPSEIIHSSDLDSSSFLYDLNMGRLYSSYRGIYSLRKRTNTLNFEKMSSVRKSYEDRLDEHGQIGFSVTFPFSSKIIEYPIGGLSFENNLAKFFRKRLAAYYEEIENNSTESDVVRYENQYIEFKLYNKTKSTLNDRNLWYRPSKSLTPNENDSNFKIKTVQRDSRDSYDEDEDEDEDFIVDFLKSIDTNVVASGAYVTSNFLGKKIYFRNCYCENGQYDSTMKTQMIISKKPDLDKQGTRESFTPNYIKYNNPAQKLAIERDVTLKINYKSNSNLRLHLIKGRTFEDYRQVAIKYFRFSLMMYAKKNLNKKLQREVSILLQNDDLYSFYEPDEFDNIWRVSLSNSFDEFIEKYNLKLPPTVEIDLSRYGSYESILQNFYDNAFNEFSTSKVLNFESIVLTRDGLYHYPEDFEENIYNLSHTSSELDFNRIDYKFKYILSKNREQDIKTLILNEFNREHESNVHHIGKNLEIEFKYFPSSITRENAGRNIEAFNIPQLPPIEPHNFGLDEQRYNGAIIYGRQLPQDGPFNMPQLPQGGPFNMPQLPQGGPFNMHQLPQGGPPNFGLDQPMQNNGNNMNRPGA